MITGANRGLGFGLARQLYLANYPGHVYMGCRDPAKTTDKLLSLRDEAVSRTQLSCVHLDLSSPQTFGNLKSTLEAAGSKLSVLVNNAGIQYPGQDLSLDRVKHMMNVNYHGQKELIEFALNNDLLAPKAKIINVSSMLGTAKAIREPAVKQKALAISSYEDIESTIEELYASIRENRRVFSAKALHPLYGFSKYMLNKYTQLLACDQRILAGGIEVYAICPGWVRTDMGGPMATLSVEEGVRAQLHLINKEGGVDSSIQGKLVVNQRPIDVN